MITLARFTNYKLLRSVEIPLGRFNVIVGANGVGKSTVLEGLHHLLQLAIKHHGGDEAVGGRAVAVFRGDASFQLLCSKPDAKHFQLEVTTAEKQRLTLQVKAADSPPHFVPRMTFDDTDGSQFDHLRPSFARASDMFERTHKARLGSVVRLRLDATNLAADHYADEATPRIEYDGAALASVLQYIQGTRDGTIEAIERDLAEIVPGASRVRSLPARITRREKIRISVDGQESWSEQTREYTGAGFEVEWAGAGWIPARQLSEGTLLTLGLLTILHFRPPRLVLLDDVDKALHPVAQRAVVELLKRILDQHPELQIVATAHSPFVLDALEPDEVLIAHTVATGQSQIRRLTEHPSWSERADYLKPGEFWSAVGEGWVTEPKA